MALQLTESRQFLFYEAPHRLRFGKLERLSEFLRRRGMFAEAAFQFAPDCRKQIVIS